MARYMTDQRRELLDFFKMHPDVAFSAKEIAEQLPDEISLSAVYRNLSWLEKSGEISRSTKEGCREIFYSYVAAESCHGCLHLTCEKCGQTVHMNSVMSEKMIHALNESDGFFVNQKKTVLYGICSKCR